MTLVAESAANEKFKFFDRLADQQKQTIATNSTLLILIACQFYHRSNKNGNRNLIKFGKELDHTTLLSCLIVAMRP